MNGNIGRKGRELAKSGILTPTDLRALPIVS